MIEIITNNKKNTEKLMILYEFLLNVYSCIFLSMMTKSEIIRVPGIV